MRDREKDRLAELVVARHCDFEYALTKGGRTYPIREFSSFAEAVRRYAGATKGDKLIHRGVVEAVHRLVDHLQTECKKLPEEVLSEADRLECLLFLGYDPYFEGDEPPGL